MSTDDIRPLTPAEADEALKNAKNRNASEEEIDRIVEAVTRGELPKVTDHGPHGEQWFDSDPTAKVMKSKCRFCGRGPVVRVESPSMYQYHCRECRGGWIRHKVKRNDH